LTVDSFSMADGGWPMAEEQLTVDS
jgi:hypothetical protein